MKQNESNFVSMLFGIGVGYMLFTPGGQQAVQQFMDAMKKKYTINNKEDKQNDEH